MKNDALGEKDSKMIFITWKTINWWKIFRSDFYNMKNNEFKDNIQIWFLLRKHERVLEINFRSDLYGENMNGFWKYISDLIFMVKTWMDFRNKFQSWFLLWKHEWNLEINFKSNFCDRKHVLCMKQRYIWDSK